jgi:hypothetical protein
MKVLVELHARQKIMNPLSFFIIFEMENNHKIRLKVSWKLIK